jgi:uncharacterized protein YdeI (YjbR/CyaY-like superfamily)
MPEPDKTRIQTFEDSAAFCQWLERNHVSEPEVWVKIYKKGSGQKTVSWDEAVVEALCWGWIDSVKKSFDDQVNVLHNEQTADNRILSMTVKGDKL